MKLSASTFIFSLFLTACTTDSVQIQINSQIAEIENKDIKLSFNLDNGYFNITNKEEKEMVIDSAFFSTNLYQSFDFKNFEAKAIEATDGKTLQIKASRPELDVIWEGTVTNHSPKIEFGMQVVNKQNTPVYIKQWSPLRGGNLLLITDKFHILDGNSGGEPTWIYHNAPVYCRNNILATTKQGEEFRTLTAGGIYYKEFEKFFEISSKENREKELANIYPNTTIIGYLNVPAMRESGFDTYITIGKGYDYEQTDAPSFEIRKSIYDSEEVIINLMNPAKDKKYAMGIALAGDNDNRWESIWVDNGPGSTQHQLCQAFPVPNYRKNGEANQIIINIPQEITQKGDIRLLIKKEKGPNAILTEAWAYEGHIPTSHSGKVSTITFNQHRKLPYKLDLYAQDPVGKRIDPQQDYAFQDMFYLDINTNNYFEALEKYVTELKQKQNININYYDFPSVCLWYAMHPYYGMGPGMNSSKGAVEEMERIHNSGFLKYSKAAVRLVPDCYEKNNEQGWWDDKHFQMHGSGNAVPGEVTVKHHYEKPYETTKKWATAVKDLGGIPLLYVQTGKRSQDYAEEYPNHMLFNESNAYIPDFTWTVDAKASYDFTDTGFINHMKEVYQRFKNGGLEGLMFDYTNTGWAQYGGMDDSYSTASEAYRKIYELAQEGMGDNSYIHERCLERGSDITLGTVSSQRIWGDTDDVTPEMVMRGGLRWYKNRVVINYDMDAKNLLKAKPTENNDGRRKLLTMCYVTSGRLLLANSFERFDSLTLWDLSRIYPFHHTPQSARPIDMLYNSIPQIYDYKVNDEWHQVTLYNQHNDKESTIHINLFDKQENGGLELDKNKKYYAYDFWNDVFIDNINDKTLKQTLRAGEARMLSIRAIQSNPQIVSCNRHIMQGYIEIENVTYKDNTLKGYINIPQNDPIEIAIALNGKQVKDISCKHADIKLIPVSDNLIKIQLRANKNSKVQWEVSFI